MRRFAYEEMAMIAKKGLVYSILCVLVLGAFLGVSQPADAASGTLTVSPGETKYLSFGTCSSGDVLLWSLEISTWSTIFESWLQAPNGVHLSLYSLTWGKIVDVPGEWKFGFSIDASGWWSATVTYATYKTTPDVEITSPLDSSYVNQESVIVTGTVDGWADEVAVSLDDVHYEDVDLYLGAWNKQAALPSDGEHTIYAEATLRWGSYVAKYYDSVTITLDRVLPEVGIVTPTDNSYLSGDLDLKWQCSDECGIALREVKVDLLDWVTVEGNSYSCELPDGEHTAQVRVTDLAGNVAVANATVVSDTVAPTITLTAPASNSKLSRDSLTISWTGSDALSGIDHYEVRISGGDWISVDLATSYTFTDLEDKWYSVTVKAVDKSGNSEESSASFGIYTSIWSANGPYDGIPLYALIAAIIIAAVASVLLFRKKRGGATITTVPEETTPESPQEGVLAAE